MEYICSHEYLYADGIITINFISQISHLYMKNKENAKHTINKADYETDNQQERGN